MREDDFTSHQSSISTEKQQIVSSVSTERSSRKQKASEKTFDFEINPKMLTQS